VSKFRKKPVVIEAVQFTAELALECLNADKPVVGDLRVSGTWHPGDQKLYSVYVAIPTLEGTMHANLNDWIITGVKGEHYPCKPDIFAATYEPA
jgi:hypothetical protein